jgi:AcrR family transcriptional regulator
MVTSRRKPRSAERDREQTRERIIDAAVRLLAQRGFGALGVNAIAREAGVDKVLLYRYFGGLSELFSALAERPGFWPRAAAPERPTASGEDLADWAKRSLFGLFRGLRERPLTQEVLRWELVARNALTDQLAELRERAGLKDLRDARLSPELREAMDVPAVAALLSAGLIYLVLRGKSAPAFLGVSLRNEEGAARVERALETIVDALAGAARPGGAR